MIFVDSSYLISLYLETDPNFFKAKSYWPKVTAQKMVSEDILRETLTVISQRNSRSATIIAYQDLLEEFSILQVTPHRFQAGLNLFLNPKLQKDISLIDCTTAAICHELKIKKILAFDPHFKSLGLTPLP